MRKQIAAAKLENEFNFQQEKAIGRYFKRRGIQLKDHHR